MISVVIPTFGRAKELRRCLEALCHQTLGSACFEVLVVDDGSQDETPELLKSFCDKWPRLRFIRQENAGPATARNTGVRNAQGDIIAFTDDDTVPPPDWLQKVQHHFCAGLKGCLYGSVRSSLPNSIFVHSVIADGSMITSNLAIEKKVLVQLGMFDCKFRSPWCEDADLYYRIQKAGFSITFDPNLVIDHPPRYQSFWSFWRKSRFFQFYGLIARKHPRMESLKQHRKRLFSCAKKLLGIALFVIIWKGTLSQAAWTGLLASVGLLWAIDAWRLYLMKRRYRLQGIHLRCSDQVLFILLNWLTTPIESYYLLKGWLLYNCPLFSDVSQC